MATTLMQRQQEAPSLEERGAAQPVARLTGAIKRYGATAALDGLDLTLHAGEIVALLGPNGAGKSTAVRLMLGLAAPTSGMVRIFGGDPRDAMARTRVGAMLQVARMVETLRVREHLDLFRSYYPRPLAVAEIVRFAQLEGIEDRMFGQLSGGQKQRVLFALALCGDPDLIFLDEPTVGMDIEARRGLWQQIWELKARGKTVLLTKHYLEEADALADRVVVINKGRVASVGTPAEIKRISGGRRIRCQTALSIAVLKAIDGVASVESADGF
jgi:ABC-2 type transport system ATP-binding protein